MGRKKAMTEVTQEQIDELRKTTPHATTADIGSVSIPPEVDAIVQAYMHEFAAPKRAADGNFPCIACGNTHAFVWGLAHGFGHCVHCSWPARLYHYVKDDAGKVVLTFRDVVLQFHPDGVSVK
jgi:hypothetical protein